MTAEAKRFWKTTSLEDMTADQWESLCDGCGICCLEKLEDADTGEIELTSISCEFMDTRDCRCLVYENRRFVNVDCIELTPESVSELAWLPDTCAYRRISAGKDLEDWHPLVSGNPLSVHKSGVSIRFKAVSVRDIHPGDISNFLSRNPASRKNL